MEQEKQQNEQLFNSVEFLFAKPYYQGHYMYALDNLESMSVIDKDSLRQLLVQLKCYDFMRTNYLLDRNLPIFFNAKEKRIEEFEDIGELDSATIKKMIHEELTINAIPQQKSNYERFFGKDSKLYQQNFNEEMLNYGNNQSIQSNLSNRKFKI
jgi:hypothetical protein